MLGDSHKSCTWVLTSHTNRDYEEEPSDATDWYAKRYRIGHFDCRILTLFGLTIC
jgi:hypothetical protein